MTFGLSISASASVRGQVYLPHAAKKPQPVGKRASRGRDKPVPAARNESLSEALCLKAGASDAAEFLEWARNTRLKRVRDRILNEKGITEDYAIINLRGEFDTIFCPKFNEEIDALRLWDDGAQGELLDAANKHWRKVQG